jgi:hypothetical protein
VQRSETEASKNEDDFSYVIFIGTATSDSGILLGCCAVELIECATVDGQEAGVAQAIGRLRATVMA